MNILIEELKDFNFVKKSHEIKLQIFSEKDHISHGTIIFEWIFENSVNLKS